MHFLDSFRGLDGKSLASEFDKHPGHLVQGAELLVQRDEPTFFDLTRPFFPPDADSVLISFVASDLNFNQPSAARNALQTRLEDAAANGFVLADALVDRSERIWAVLFLHRRALADPDRAVAFIKVAARTHRLAFGGFQDIMREKVILSGRFYEQRMVANMTRASPADAPPVLIDVGANIGNHSIGFVVGSVPGAMAYGFEVGERAFELLTENIALNELDGAIIARNVGLGEESGTGYFAAPKTNLGGGRVEAHPSRGRAVPIEPLDELWDFSIRPTVMKVDVEGMELPVLRGAARILSTFEPVLYIEAARPQQAQAIAAHLEPYGYEFIETFNHTPTHRFDVPRSPPPAQPGSPPQPGLLRRVVRAARRRLAPK